MALSLAPGTGHSPEAALLSKSHRLQLPSSSSLETVSFLSSFSCLQTFLVLSSLKKMFLHSFLNALCTSMVGHSLPCIMVHYTHVRFNHSSLKSLGRFQNTQAGLFHPGKQNATEGPRVFRYECGGQRLVPV